MKIQLLREKQEKAIVGDRYKPRQMDLSQPISEQRKSSPASTIIRRTPSEINEKQSPKVIESENMASMIRMKRHIKGKSVNASLDALPTKADRSTLPTKAERSTSLNALPMIPEKGYPALALKDLKEHGKAQSIPIKNKIPSQYESTKNLSSGSENIFQDRTRDLVKASPYSKLLPDYQRGDYTAIMGNLDPRKLTVDPRLALIDKAGGRSEVSRPISNYSIKSRTSSQSKATLVPSNHKKPEVRAQKALA